ncbi:bifunctional 3-(3-hydroxy-phenyl)propionate/3-hydroxycinnamic acid hydroxylase [Bradyrhizobium sp. U87765 SZCCT0131]|uniref:bifunctional 3-(3-hydroxy-phenyl)propionate/3-hydroxycinnamic acid hydroxylase MhpA n=1 Tax=unclassified Bradyrhizobium TaxID=2631580 RepID=UPI001BA8FE67|nr:MULTISPECIES: bifunctional 3-(3-hydroxy-phenyl)propionate/3-hydroxycinnamic acid hydroxylase [unclassified Bradyrhizobium]MBR1218827.1 bifunctional 3-(3-hydroxy-phenyl)propionate/3-hydroxycinnamic acid hydroxylase [Bradyrhizobium sp. U87765 SZCCT0131]MBR1261478.1 bifunctional 3-(3-hydroxy-phenyl)propionate/3-hydroxycinnamic acid hydroxylase [Bradyrhizobium sp. U87765 SZCCT0134]MBR1306669.1 bifunctional 3-(3-hydroxy-phenyl)propionate/3-hydroxycinnamic acid hydroxylase [Bradyrhizobium sp. U8776
MTQTIAPASTCDVAVIGCGPVGATLANLLGLCGLRTTVLEREARAYHLPRAVHFDDEAMRVFQTIGLSEPILPHVTLSPGMRFVDAEGRMVLDWSRSAALTPMGWHLSYRFHQPDLEAVLNAGLARWPTVDVRHRCDVYAIDQDHDGVRVRYEDLATGKLEELRAAYVVGCDGARSLVRRFIGSAMDDLGFHERWLVVDVLLKRDRSDLGDYSIQHCNPQRPATYIRGTGTRRRWEITVLPHEDAFAVSQPARTWELLAPWITPDDADIERAAVYTFHSTIAERWRNGRLLLAGDSAHQTPPFLGQGMCAGIRDAANLAWKLAAVISGRSRDSLLDTYQSERAPHVREFIELAIRLGGLINTKATEQGLAAGIAHKDAPAKLEVKKPLLGPGLAAGAATLTGTVAPQFTLRGGRRGDDAVGYGFALLADTTLARDIAAADHAALAAAGVTLLGGADATGLDDWLGGHGLRAVLMRPDRYVLGAVRRGHDTELQDLAALLTALDGATQVPTAA